MGYISEMRSLIGTRPMFLTGAAVLVFNAQGHLLLQRRSDTGDWGTLGGSMELGETLEDAARRELWEEAGITAKDITFKMMLSGSDMYYKYPNGDEVYNVLAVFEIHDYDGEPAVNDSESLELRFFPLDSPVDHLNAMAGIILRKAGYISWQ